MTPGQLTNLRPAWPKGKSGNPKGNAFAAMANQFRSSIWEASTPERRTALAEMLWALSLGKYEVPALDRDGLPILDPDGSPRMKCLPPQPWAIQMLLDRLIGQWSFKQIEAEINFGSTTDRDALVESVKMLRERGMLQMVPSRLQEMPVVDQPADPTPAR